MAPAQNNPVGISVPPGHRLEFLVYVFVTCTEPVCLRGLQLFALNKYGAVTNTTKTQGPVTLRTEDRVRA